MEIERQWSQLPGWFSQQSRSDQLQLLAWMRVKLDPKGQHYNAAPRSAQDFWGSE